MGDRPDGGGDRPHGDAESKRFDASGADASGAGDGRPGPVVRRCMAPGCDAYACFGQGVLLDGDPAREKWWCAAHRPERPGDAGGPGGEPEPPKDGKQSKLGL